MADRERRGLVARWLEGKERSEDYARSTLPTSRWGLFWDILKGRFGRLILVNLMVFVTCIPIILIVFFHSYSLAALGASGSFGSGLGIGYPYVPFVPGQSEWAIMQLDLFYFGLLIPACVIAGVGISGGMYIIRNLIWTEGIFVANDFLRGIKRNFFNVMEAAIFFSVILFLATIVGDLADFFVAVGSTASGWMVASKVVGYILVALATLITLWMISLGVNYKQGPFALLRNAVVMTVGTFPQTVFFAVLATWPVFLCIFGQGFLLIVGMIILILFGISWLLLVWMDYSQWAFDKFVNPEHGIATGRGLYNKDKAAENGARPAQVGLEESAVMREMRRQIVAQGKSKLVCRPIKPVDDGVDMYQLPESFSREDLQKLRESRAAVEEDVKQYEEEHKGDAQYVEYNRFFEEQERAIREEEANSGGKKKKKKKNAKPPKLLNKR